MSPGFLDALFSRLLLANSGIDGWGGFSLHQGYPFVASTGPPPGETTSDGRQSPVSERPLMGDAVLTYQVLELPLLPIASVVSEIPGYWHGIGI